MKNFELDENFREAFKKVSLKNKGKLLAELSGVFELPEFHFSRCVLNRYYKKIFEINFNKDLALRVLLNFFGDASFSIFDYSAPFYGGYPIGKREIVNDDELIKELVKNPDFLNILSAELTRLKYKVKRANG